MANQPELSIRAGRVSLLLLIPAIATIALSFGIRHFLDTTPDIEDGELSDINYFVPWLILKLAGFSGVVLSIVGCSLGFQELSRVKPRDPYVIAGTILHTVLVVGWLAQSLRPLYEIFLQ